eukprot:CAMPEP_0178495856 /NCGR_PEP_ID=MMETSP0696-20121128/13781_1 /TAXON_ID=265572 /ORGANISM="Extubocellulus spinifer, Strain CCMP396" /LENGTH=542 /DNA_ID=CAMNT_0020124049 /DNA_START=307 /DNA_END=1935 /DNA_ORIENTATION=-
MKPDVEMAESVEMDPQDKHLLSTILFAAGYRGAKLDTELHRRSTLSPTTGQVIALDLTCCEFMEIPPAIGYLLELQSLDLTYCKRITALPKEISRLVHLKRLDLYCCENLESLPPELGRLASTLDHLDVFGCTAMTVPPKDVRAAPKAVLPFLRSLLTLRDDPSPMSVGQLRSDPRILLVAAKDSTYAASLGKVVGADKGLATLPIDNNGRVETVLDIACEECRAAIESALYFYRRYELEGDGDAQQHRAYESETAIIHHANDHGSSPPLPVVLKFFPNKKCFLTEQTARTSQKNGGQRFYPEYVIPALQYHDGDTDTNFRTAAETLSLPPYCIVLERGGRSLLETMFFEHHLSGNVAEARYVLEQLAKAIVHLHRRGVIHGKLNPRNIVRSPARGGKYSWRLVDLSSAVAIGNAVHGNMIKSAHSPPEAVDVYGPNAQEGQGALVAHGSYDVWSFGTIMYRLLARVPLVEGTDDNGALLHEGISTLQKWSDESLKERLSAIVDQDARDLLSYILQRQPENRPTMEEVLDHAFFRTANYMSQ